MSTANEELAYEALHLAGSDPGRALLLAARAAETARAQRDRAAGSIAARARGLAAFHREDLDTATTHLREAIALARRSRSTQLAAEAQMTLSFVLQARGQVGAAMRTIDAALRDLVGVARARAEAQRGAILHQIGRLDEALACYQAALPVLRRAEDLQWVQRILANRGNLRTHRQELGPAEADLQEARQLCLMLDMKLTTGLVEHNLGFLYTLRGDVPAALDYLDRAERCFHAFDTQRGSLLVDRAELLLSVRLIAEARETAEQAVLVAQREGRRIVQAEARLLLARSALLAGDLPEALGQARWAAREFGRHRQAGWAALARLIGLVADARSGRASIARLERTAEAVAQQWPAAALEGRLAAIRAALDRGRAGQAHRLFRLASRSRRSGPATLRARAWYAEALLRQATGDHRGVASAARAGLRILDEHAAALGATDLRAHVAGHRTDLAELGLRVAVHDGRAEKVFAWAERGRASHLLYPPVRPPQNPVLAADLAELRATIRDIDDLGGSDRSTARLRQHQTSLERRVRDHHRRQRGDAASYPATLPTAASLSQALDEAALVEFVQLDGMMHVVTVLNGRCRLRAVGPVAEIDDLVSRVPFALHTLARHDAAAASRDAATVLLRRSAGRLDTLLFAPLPETADRPLVLIPTGPLQSLPWSVLPSCTGRPVTVSPSAALWYSATSRDSDTFGHVCVAAGPGLPSAQYEAEQVAAIHRGTALTGRAATVDAVTAALNGAGFAHLAAHGRVRADNPLFSSLRLADGPLMVYDLEELRRPPSTVVLAACDTGRPVVRTGDEVLGLTATLLAQGTTQLIAPVLTILDVETTPLMMALHRQLAAGEPAAVALATAQQHIASDDLTGLATGAGFVCLGAGFRPSHLPPATPTLT